MANSQPAILMDLQKYQWYVHMSRTENADLGLIKSAIQDSLADAAAQGVNLCVLFGPTLADDLEIETDDFQAYPGYESPDGSRVAKGTQEELLMWLHHADKDLIWEVQHTFRKAVAIHLEVARETPTFIYKNSLDLTGHIDGTGNPEPEDQKDRGIVDDGQTRRRVAATASPNVGYTTWTTGPRSPLKKRRIPSGAPSPTQSSLRPRCRLRTCHTSSYAKAPPPMSQPPSGVRWFAAPPPMRSTRALSDSISWVSARRKHRCVSAWKPCMEPVVRHLMPSPTTPLRPRVRFTSLLL